MADESKLKSRKQLALEALTGDVCACGNRKRKEESFCKSCYFKLPVNLRNKLYATFSDGYVENYEDSKDWLRDNT